MSDGVTLLGGHAVGHILHGSTYELTFSAFSRFSLSVNAFKNEDLHKIYDPNISQQNMDAEEAQI